MGDWRCAIADRGNSADTYTGTRQFSNRGRFVANPDRSGALANGNNKRTLASAESAARHGEIVNTGARDRIRSGRLFTNLYVSVRVRGRTRHVGNRYRGFRKIYERIRIARETGKIVSRQSDTQITQSNFLHTCRINRSRTSDEFLLRERHDLRVDRIEAS